MIETKYLLFKLSCIIGWSKPFTKGVKVVSTLNLKLFNKYILNYLINMYMG